MDDGRPFRAPQPGDRRVGRPALAQRQSDEPQSTASEPKAVQRAVESRQRTRKSSKWLKLLLAAVAVVAVGVIGWLAWSNTQNSGTAIDESKYQAVFFTNGQVYFGKLQPYSSEYMKLTDIYYLQSQQSSVDSTDSDNPQETSSDQGNVQLIKLGDEIHGPEDEMIISKSQMLFYENLKPDSKVVKSIDNHKKNN